jgi:hypothetical protein
VPDASLRLAKFASIASLITLAWTLLCGVMIVGWQAKFWVQDGIWPDLSIAFILNALEGHAAYQTASAETVQTSADRLLGLPAIVPVLIASAVLTAFYLWLVKVERASS